jgi:hypothetical protein
MVSARPEYLKGCCDVRYGSKADICSAKRHVRFTLNSDRESGFPKKVMSALPPKADMCGALEHVRFGPIADSCSAAIIVRLLHRCGRAAVAKR